jgi:hypothetical protein
MLLQSLTIYFIASYLFLIVFMKFVDLKNVVLQFNWKKKLFVLQTFISNFYLNPLLHGGTPEPHLFYKLKK